ncbi:hypothetical protein LCGC14_1787400 [marine sediment metagenome]|uniref:Uncharacterized protein n=1 Tax=marine sediment metagenome TaxID=412755 RepID=A0A0F9J8G7_9ZZZZ
MNPILHRHKMLYQGFMGRRTMIQEQGEGKPPLIWHDAFCEIYEALEESDRERRKLKREIFNIKRRPSHRKTHN